MGKKHSGFFLRRRTLCANYVPYRYVIAFSTSYSSLGVPMVSVTVTPGYVH